jgi:hypothetical protein
VSRYSSVHGLNPDDELELRALVGLAWERRGEPDFREHVEAIADWHDRRFVREFERRQRSFEAVRLALRDPARAGDHDHDRVKGRAA